MINAKTKARWDYYSTIEGAKIMGHEQGKLEGKIEGANEKALQMARILLARNIDLQIISEVTGLNQNEIQALK